MLDVVVYLFLLVAQEVDAAGGDDGDGGAGLSLKTE